MTKRRPRPAMPCLLMSRTAPGLLRPRNTWAYFLAPGVRRNCHVLFFLVVRRATRSLEGPRSGGERR